MPNPIAKEPVAVQALAGLLVWAAARYGFHVDDEQALQIAGAVALVLAPFVRQLVTPATNEPPRLLPLFESAERIAPPRADGDLVDLGAPPPTTSTQTGGPVDYDG